jgi:hypothetical protein
VGEIQQVREQPSGSVPTGTPAGIAQVAPLGPLRQAFLTRLYELPIGHLSGSINRFVVPAFESEQHVYPTVFATGTPGRHFLMCRIVVVTIHAL